MKQNKILGSIGAVVLSAFTFSASAITIDFQGVASPGVQQAVGQNYVEDGYNFFNPGQTTDAAIIGQPSQNTSGSDYYTWNSPAANNPVTLSALDSSLFALFSLDVGAKNSSSSLSTFDITGYFSGGGSIVSHIVNASSFSSVALNWNNLTHVEFRYISGNFGAIDNLVINAATSASQPVPDGGMTVAMLGMALGGLGLLRRKF